MNSIPSEDPSTSISHASTGPFMLTLCRLSSPGAFQAPRAPQLKAYKFFTTRSRHSDGSERVYLHMGYFATLAGAQKYAQALSKAYPNAIATQVPAALLRHVDSGIPTLPAAPNTANTRGSARSSAASLSDMQVLNILEKPSAQPRAHQEPLSDLFAQQLDEALESDRVRTQAAAAAAPAPASSPSRPLRAAAAQVAATPASQFPPGSLREPVKSVEEPGELLAPSELWGESDPSGTAVSRRF